MMFFSTLLPLAVFHVLLLGSQTEAAAVGCPGGFVENSGNCFLFSSITANWLQARTICQTLGSIVGRTIDLAELGDSAQWLMDQISAKKQRVWLGASDPKRDGNWVWTHSGTKLPKGRNNYPHWHNGEPNNEDGNEYCLDTHLWPNGMYLNDAPCHDLKHYVCEIFN